MAPYHIRKYQESDRQRVLDLFFQGMLENVPNTYRHILKLPRTLALLLGGPLILFLVTGSWLLVPVAGLTLLFALRIIAKYPWTEYVASCLRTDLSDITRSYFRERGSSFWVAESENKVVGMVGALPIEEPTRRKKQVEILHLSVDSEYRCQGIARALVRTLLQFAWDQGYSEVVLSTSMMQYSGLAFYQSMGFQNTGSIFYSKSWALIAVPILRLTYQLPSAQVSQVPRQREAYDLQQ